MRWSLTQHRFVSHQDCFGLIGDIYNQSVMLIFFEQGLSQIIEDIGVLQTLLLSSPYLDISVISRFWEDIRKPRVERIKSYAAWNTQMFLGNKNREASHTKYADADWKSIKDIKPDSTADFTSPAFFKWAHDYDVIEQVSLSSHSARVHSHTRRREKRMQSPSLNTNPLTREQTYEYLEKTKKANPRL